MRHPVTSPTVYETSVTGAGALPASVAVAMAARRIMKRAIVSELVFEW